VSLIKEGCPPRALRTSRESSIVLLFVPSTPAPKEMKLASNLISKPLQAFENNEKFIQFAAKTDNPVNELL
jgi:hypothetical protein